MLLGHINSSNGVLLCVCPFSMQILEVSCISCPCGLSKPTSCPKESSCALDRHWNSELLVFIQSKTTATLLFWLIDVSALQNFWRPPFIVLPFISYYYSDFCIIFLTFNTKFSSFFISTVDDGVTPHMALPSVTASLAHSFWAWSLPLASMC